MEPLTLFCVLAIAVFCFKPLFSRKKVPDAPDSIIPTEPFTLKYHFDKSDETDLDKINADLAKYVLSNVEYISGNGYVATTTKFDQETGAASVRKRYGLTDCVLRCIPPTRSERYHFQIVTMTTSDPAAKGNQLFRAAYPHRHPRTTVTHNFGENIGIIVLHHEI